MIDIFKRVRNGNGIRVLHTVVYYYGIVRHEILKINCEAVKSGYGIFIPVCAVSEIYIIKLDLLEILKGNTELRKWECGVESVYIAVASTNSVKY